MYLCVCVRVRACACVCVGARALACAFARALLLIQTAKRRRIVMRPLWLDHSFRHYLIRDTIFGKKVKEYKMCFDFLYNFCLKQFSF